MENTSDRGDSLGFYERLKSFMGVVKERRSSSTKQTIWSLQGRWFGKVNKNDATRHAEAEHRDANPELLLQGYKRVHQVL